MKPDFESGIAGFGNWFQVWLFLYGERSVNGTDQAACATQVNRLIRQHTMPPRIPPSFSFQANTATFTPGAGPSSIPQAALPAQPARLIDSLWPSGIAGQPDPHAFILPATRSSPEDVFPLNQDAVNKLFAAIRASQLRSAPAPMVTPVEQPHGYANPHAPRTLIYLLPSETHTGMQAILHIGSGNALQRLELYKLVTPTMELDGSARVTHFAVPDLPGPTTPGRTYPPARGWTAALIDTVREAAVAAEPAHGRRRERPGSGSSENAPPVQRRKTHPGPAGSPAPHGGMPQAGHGNAVAVPSPSTVEPAIKPFSQPESIDPNVRWQNGRNRWMVQFKGDDDEKPQFVSVHISKHDNDIDKARRVAEDIAAQFRAGTYVRQPKAIVEHTSDVHGVRWEDGGSRWIIEIKERDGAKIQKKTVPISAHGNDIDAARIAAEGIAAEMLAGTYVHQPRATAEYTSHVSGVTWEKGRSRWVVKMKGRDGAKAQNKTVPISAHGNDIEATRIAAEGVAAEMLAGTYVHQPRATAEYTSHVSGVSWERGRSRWVVQLKGPGDENRQFVGVHISKHGNDIDATRIVAEDIARQITEGTYVHQPGPSGMEKRKRP